MTAFAFSLLQATFGISNPGFISVDGSSVIGFFKLLFVLSAFLYLLFAFVVTRQIKVMRTTLITPVAPIIRVLGYAHFALAALVFLGIFLFL